MKNYFTKTIAIVCMIGLLTPSVAFLSYPKHAQAVVGTVQIGTSWDFNNIMAHLEKFTLSRLANIIAKQILHQLTASIIDWINSGFQGNPSFLDNPQAFFLDAADQITGVFLDPNTSPLKFLCGNMNLDLSLALAFGQGSFINKRYTCTLGSIFTKLTNLPNTVSIQGRSLSGFMRGDFSQGGWKGFLSVSQQPKNNATGAYLQAHGDLLHSIGIKKNALKSQLTQGSGLLSWDSCTDTTAGAVNTSLSGSGSNSLIAGMMADSKSHKDAAGQASIDTGNGSSIHASIDSTGLVKYQNCRTQTPGSLISSQLNKAIGSPVLELELANDINAIISALVTQMVSQVMSAGLGGISRSPSGGGQSATQAIITDIQNRQAAMSSTITLTGNGDTSISSIKGNYDSAVRILTTSKSNYQIARNCFANKAGLSSAQQAYALNQIGLIDIAVNTRLDPLLNHMLGKQSEIAASMPQINVASTTDAQTLDTLVSQIDTLQQSIATNNVNGSAITQGPTTVASTTTAGIAISDLGSAQTSATQFNAEAAQYSNLCNGL